MQVSWIEPDEVRALAALLQDAAPMTSAGAWDVHTLPEVMAPPPQPLLPHEPVAVPHYPVHHAAAPIAAPASIPTPAPAPEVAMIRETLRVIRDRAKQAGLLQEEIPVPPPPSPPVPLVAPMAPAATAPMDRLPSRESLRALTTPAPQQTSSPDSNLQYTASPGAAAFLPVDGTLTERLENFASWAIQLTSSEDVLLLDDHGGLLWGQPPHPDLVVLALLSVQNALRSSAGSLHQPPDLLSAQFSERQQLSIIPCSTRFGLATLVLVNANDFSAPLGAALREALLLTVESSGS